MSLQKKLRLVDRRCERFKSYNNCRMGRYRRRQYLFVHLSSEDDALSLMNQSTSAHNPDQCMHIAFTRFDKSNIDEMIKTARSTENNRTIKASNILPELD